MSFTSDLRIVIKELGECMTMLHTLSNEANDFDYSKPLNNAWHTLNDERVKLNQVLDKASKDIQIGNE
ncbi:hypothetical protein LCGC14_0861660 [marine sediment metagenome]|uniref:Uncharacterized protein n=1 Tax=marine sediment metagenome TaxID=412755 RepID=A0A0F9P717_9ZZZZ